MRKKELAFVLLGFLVGAAALAGGEEDYELIEQLRALQQSAERVILKSPSTGDYAPAVGPGYKLGLFPVYDLTYGVPDHIPPARGYMSEDSESPLFGGISEECPQPYGTIEELTELVRTSVEPSSWDEGGTISPAGQTLIVFHSPVVLEKIGTFLNALRERAFVCVSLDVQLVELPATIQRQLGAGGAANLTDEQVDLLNRALAAGKGEVLFFGSAFGLSRQRVYLSHGEQHAVLSDADVEVAQTASTTDPNVDVLQTGGFVSYRASVGGRRDRIALDLEAQFDDLELPIRTRETTNNGILDMPVLQRGGFRTAITVGNGRWALAGIGGVGDDTRLLLVKASIVLPKGGAR